jgi:hypothetical protein
LLVWGKAVSLHRFLKKAFFSWKNATKKKAKRIKRVHLHILTLFRISQCSSVGRAADL